MTPESADLPAWEATRCRIIKGLTHEMNNIIAATYSLSEFHSTHSNDNSVLKKAIKNIQKNTSACYNLLQQLTNLFNKDNEEMEYFNLEHMIEELCPFIHVLLPKGVSIQMAFTNKEIAIYGSIGELSKKILNLICEIGSEINQQGIFHIETDLCGISECTLRFKFSTKEEVNKDDIHGELLMKTGICQYELLMNLSIENLIET